MANVTDPTTIAIASQNQQAPLASIVSYLRNLATGQVAGSTPTGMISAYGGVTAPTGWVICDGTSYLRAGTYANLFTVLGTAYGTADATHFNVPDLRGKFPRGWDHGAGNDPDAAGRTASTGGASGDNIGSLEADAMQGHFHSAPQTLNGAVGAAVDTIGGALTATTGSPITDGTNGTPRISSETRPKNVNVQYIIKI